jgi:regulator of protease activity HflC (stomatin/prohibitin superfamily)
MSSNNGSGAMIGPIVFFGLAAVLGLLILLVSCGQVAAGQRGVVTRYGAVTGEIKGEGLFFVTPFVEGVHKMNVQVARHDADVGAASKDLQDVKTKVTLNFHLDPAKVGEVYRNLREDYESRVIEPTVQEATKAVTATHEAQDLIVNRPVVKGQLEAALTSRLAQYGILVDAVNITDFDFSASFTAAIESKQVAVQSALEAENRLRQIEVEARQAQARAVGARDAAIEQANGEAKAILTVAQAQADANRLLTSSLSESIIRYELVRKLGDDVKVIVLPTGQQFILGESVLGGPLK